MHEAEESHKATEAASGLNDGLGSPEDQVLMVLESHFNTLVRKVKLCQSALGEIRDRGRYLEGDGCADLAEKVIAEIDAA